MLPFLKLKKQTGGVIVENRTPEHESDDKDDFELDSLALEECAKDLIQAIERKDSKAAASAIKAAFEILDSQPHEEGPHLNESE